MAYQVKTTQSYGKRLGNSLKGVVSGFLMFIIGTILLFWNEGNYVKTKNSINEAQSVVVKVDDVSSLNADLNGKLVYGVSKALTNDILTDALFDVSVNAVKLSRKVEYYQWKESSKSETRDKIGGGQETITTYDYKKEWTSSPENSSSFADPSYQGANKVLTTIEDKTQVANHVSWGAYALPSFIKNAISGNTPVNIQLSEESKAAWRKTLAIPEVQAPAQTASQTAAQDDLFSMGSTTTTTTTAPVAEYIHVSGNTVYLGENPSVPAIGDVRVSLSYTPPGGDLSVIAQVQGDTFTQYVAKNGKSFSSVQNGVVSAEQMFESEHSANSMITWILRLVGLFLVMGGLKSMFSILPAIFKVLPFLGNVVGAGVSLVCSVVGFVWAFLIVAISWMFYRPLIGILFLVLAIAGIWFLNKKAKEKKAAAAASAPAPPVPPAEIV